LPHDWLNFVHNMQTDELELGSLSDRTSSKALHDELFDHPNQLLTEDLSNVQTAKSVVKENGQPKIDLLINDTHIPTNEYFNFPFQPDERVDSVDTLLKQGNSHTGSEILDYTHLSDDALARLDTLDQSAKGLLNDMPRSFSGLELSRDDITELNARPVFTVDDDDHCFDALMETDLDASFHETVAATASSHSVEGLLWDDDEFVHMDD